MHDLKASQEIISNWNQANCDFLNCKNQDKSQNWTLILNIQNIF